MATWEYWARYRLRQILRILLQRITDPALDGLIREGWRIHQETKRRPPARRKRA